MGKGRSRGWIRCRGRDRSRSRGWGRSRGRGRRRDRGRSIGRSWSGRRGTGGGGRRSMGGVWAGEEAVPGEWQSVGNGGVNIVRMVSGAKEITGVGN